MEKRNRTAGVEASDKESQLKSLALAMVSQAVLDVVSSARTYVKNGGHSTILDRDNAYHWIDAKETRVGGFDWACQLSGLPPAHIRDWVHEVLPTLSRNQRLRVALKVGNILSDKE